MGLWMEDSAVGQSVGNIRTNPYREFLQRDKCVMAVDGAGCRGMTQSSE